MDGQTGSQKAKVFCSMCYKEIVNREDLVVSGFFPVAYCPACYARAARGFLSGPSRVPPNSTLATVLAGVGAAVAAAVLLFRITPSLEERVILAALLSIPAVLRLGSWLMYERHLK